MAKTKTKTKSSKKARRKDAPGATLASVLQNIAQHEHSPAANIDALVARATSLLHEHADPQQALATITRALAKNPVSLPALELAGEINVELEDTATAIRCFTAATELDPDGKSSGAEKFLWLAELCDEGGDVAVRWYQRAVEFLRAHVAEAKGDDKQAAEQKLCSALCGIAELYMTDLWYVPDSVQPVTYPSLPTKFDYADITDAPANTHPNNSMHPAAESNCETHITEALLVSPSSPEALSTLASLRISQSKPSDARAALTRSLDAWQHLPPTSPQIPAYPARMSFTRLLIECDMHEEAMDVLEGLQAEDDQSVDLWYLGGWCLFLIGAGLKEGAGVGAVAGAAGAEVEDWRDTWAAAREWLWNCEKLYRAFEWQDVGIAEHASELLARISVEIGEAKPEDAEEKDGDDGDDGEVDGGEWEDDDDDEEMGGS
ncbi:hypothetical protein DRE_02190 [Drechslerella stenobrocha 248]|uniref:Uncharacterized protein n=1 Tax=Drechslerella stenobrocha 248 TaxID=1043628 RepID=W7HW74_9PEZI|nr:hypothetical protein DRE_02190 [Drechslerella stenobrocha 248]